MKNPLTLSLHNKREPKNRIAFHRRILNPTPEQRQAVEILEIELM